MAKDYTVAQAFLGTVSKEDKTPTIVQSKAGPCHKYIFKVEGQEMDGWLNILRKIDENGNAKPLNQGDTVYGDVVENNWGKAQFEKAQKPYTPGQQSAPTQASAPAAKAPMESGNTEMEAKVDYIISLLENFLDSQKGTEPSRSVEGDDSPVDLSQIDY
jgi:hypothetical protein